MQDSMVTSQQMPGHLNHVSGYSGFQPRCPTAAVGSAEWASIVQPDMMVEYELAEDAPAEAGEAAPEPAAEPAAEPQA